MKLNSSLCYFFYGFWLLGCTVGPDFVRPNPNTPQEFITNSEGKSTLQADGITQSFESGFQVPERWWELFGSSALNEFVQQAIQKNHTLESALASLQASQESLTAGYGVFYPQMDGSAGVTRQRLNSPLYGQNARGGIFNLFSISGSVSYTLDIFGGERRELEGLLAELDAQKYLVSATYLTLTSNIVNAVVARAAYKAEIDFTQELLKIELEEVDITQAQVKSGSTPYGNLLSIQTQLYSTQATLAPLQLHINQSDHLLAVLSGQFPSEWGKMPVELSSLKLPRQLPKSVPSELIRQRPDILNSEALLHLASANVGVATAALYPRFSLSGGYEVSQSSTESLLNSDSSFWNLGANLTGPIFSGGSLRAKKKSAEANYQAALENYRAVVLNSLSQVADTLRALEHDAESLSSFALALSSSFEGLSLTQANYQAGTANYLQVLNANTQYYQAKLGHIQASAQRLQDSVALFVALGGGYSSRDPTAKLPTPLLDRNQSSQP